MKIAAIICNIVLFVFHCFVLLTDGFPREAIYIIFNLWSLLTLILSLIVIFYIGIGHGWLGSQAKTKVPEGRKKINSLFFASTRLRKVAIICNIVFLGFVCWSLADQYPHPKENGVVAFMVLMVLTPILNLVVLISSGVRDGWIGLNMKGNQ
jgi:hypothetical protein